MTYRNVSKIDVAYSVITEQILAALDKNVVPWRKPWSLPIGQRPHNAITKHSYTGINSIMLAFSGRKDPRWITLRQVLARGGRVTRSEFRKATQIVFWKSFSREVEDKDTGETKTTRWGMYRYYRVYNVEQCEGLKLPAIESVDTKDFDPIAEAETIVENMPLRPAITHDGNDGAYYVPAKDAVHMPKREHFDSSGEYYSTLFHELGHSTGHAKRLNRHGMETGIAPFGSETYSREELAAEFTNAFVCAAAGIDNTLENSASYIAGWAKAIRSDIKLVIMAASQGQKAADYILAGQPIEPIEPTEPKAKPKANKAIETLIANTCQKCNKPYGNHLERSKTDMFHCTTCARELSAQWRCPCGYSAGRPEKFFNHQDRAGCGAWSSSPPPLKRNKLGGIKAPLPPKGGAAFYVA